MGPGTHVGIAVDAAAPAAATEALALHRRLIGRSSTAGTTPTAGITTVATSALLGDEVFRDLRLIEVLFVDERCARRGRRIGRRPDLRIPEGPERRGPRTARSWGGLDLIVLVLVLVTHRRPRRGDRSGRGDRRGRSGPRGALWRAIGLALELPVLAPTATTTTTTTATSAAAAGPFAILGTLISTVRTIGSTVHADRAGVLQIVQCEHLGGRHVGLRQRSRRPREPFARQRDQAACRLAPNGAIGGSDRHRPRPAAATSRRRNRFGITASASATATTATRTGALGQLVGHLGHRQIRVVALGDAAPGA